MVGICHTGMRTSAREGAGLDPGRPEDSEMRGLGQDTWEELSQKGNPYCVWREGAWGQL